MTEKTFKTMADFLKRGLVLLLFFSFPLAYAGSYEDFFTAIKRDDARTLTQLLSQGFDVNTLNPAGEHGLLLAAREPSLQAAAVLLAQPKVNADARNRQDESALMLASLQGLDALCQQLIAQGASVNKPGWTPLHYAATHGHLTVITLLLDNYAYIDAASPNGTTPLMMAAHYGTPSAVKQLLEAGADPLLKNAQDLSAIDFAHRANRLDVAEIIAAFVRSRQPKGVW